MPESWGHSWVGTQMDGGLIVRPKRDLGYNGLMKLFAAKSQTHSMMKTGFGWGAGYHQTLCVVYELK